MAKLTLPAQELMYSGHAACPGCGAALSMRLLLKGLGPRTVVSVPACCWTVIATPYPTTALGVAMLDNPIEATGASISGIRAALDAMGQKDVNVVGFAGDGGTADIGIQSLSGMLERRTNAIYVMYDNEAYMNTGIQRSGETPLGAWTTTTPVEGAEHGKVESKKDMMAIVLAPPRLRGDVEPELPRRLRTQGGEGEGNDGPALPARLRAVRARLEIRLPEDDRDRSTRDRYRRLPALRSGERPLSHHAKGRSAETGRRVPRGPGSLPPLLSRSGGRCPGEGTRRMGPIGRARTRVDGHPALGVASVGRAVTRRD